jgi:hypothetical protein
MTLSRIRRGNGFPDDFEGNGISSTPYIETLAASRKAV